MLTMQVRVSLIMCTRTHQLRPHLTYHGLPRLPLLHAFLAVSCMVHRISTYRVRVARTKATHHRMPRVLAWHRVQPELAKHSCQTCDLIAFGSQKKPFMRISSNWTIVQASWISRLAQRRVLSSLNRIRQVSCRRISPNTKTIR